MDTRKAYPSDVSDEEWEFVAPYLALLREDVPQRDHDLRQAADRGVFFGACNYYTYLARRPS